jgi:hypothetical protein
VFATHIVDLSQCHVHELVSSDVIATSVLVGPDVVDANIARANVGVKPCAAEPGTGRGWWVLARLGWVVDDVVVRVEASATLVVICHGAPCMDISHQGVRISCHWCAQSFILQRRKLTYTEAHREVADSRCS